MPHAALLLAALSGTAFAQPDAQPSSQSADRSPKAPPAEVADAKSEPAVEINLGAAHYFDADFDAGPGELSTTRASLGASVAFPLAERRRLTVGIELTESWYDFSNATGLDASGDPFDNATEIDLTAAYAAPVNDTTSYFVQAMVGSAGESGSDFSDTLVYGGALGFITKQSDTFQWGLGVAVRTRLEDDALIIPLPQIRLSLSDRWTLATERAGVTLDYKANDDLHYGLLARFDSRTFRLDDNGPIPAGVATEERIPVAFYARYNPDPSVTIDAEVGAAVYSNIELFDTFGNELTDDDVDPSVYVAVSARFRF